MMLKLNNWASNLVIAVIFLVVGYFLYPIVNTVENLEPTKIEGSSQNHSSNVVAKEAIVKIESTATESHSQVTENLVNTETGLGSQESGESHSQKVDSVGETRSSPVNSSDLQQNTELTQWAEGHKSKINELITAHAPESIAKNVIDKVNTDNPFITNPEIKQDVEHDDNWAYIIEQDLSTYINNHQLADQFKLLNVSCKQLMCDVLGTELESQGWIKIFFGMFKNIPGLLSPNESKNSKSLTYLNGDGTSTIYFQLEFKQS